MWYNKLSNEREVNKTMTKAETIEKIIEAVEQCEATEEECNDCVMCHFCCGYYTGDWSIERGK
jgi:hypothetical protein